MAQTDVYLVTHFEMIAILKWFVVAHMLTIFHFYCTTISKISHVTLCNLSKWPYWIIENVFFSISKKGAVAFMNSHLNLMVNSFLWILLRMRKIQQFKTIVKIFLKNRIYKGISRIVKYLYFKIPPAKSQTIILYDSRSNILEKSS